MLKADSIEIFIFVVLFLHESDKQYPHWDSESNNSHRQLADTQRMFQRADEKFPSVSTHDLCHVFYKIPGHIAYK